MEAPLLPAQQGGPAIGGNAAAVDPTGPAAVDPFVATFGRFQLKMFALAGGTAALMSAWIMLPVFINPVLRARYPEDFTSCPGAMGQREPAVCLAASPPACCTERLAALGSFFFLGWASRLRDCHFADALSPSLLKHRPKVEWGCSRMTASPTAQAGPLARRSPPWWRTG